MTRDARIDADHVLAALPMPAVVIDAADRILDANPAAEGFLNGSVRSLRGVSLWDRLQIAGALGAHVARARQDGMQLVVNDVELRVGQRPSRRCSLRFAPVDEGRPGDMVLLVVTSEIGPHIGAGRTVQSSAKSAIGMAEMLAHEIKNPLAGIVGAAQLLGMNAAAGDGELTALIVDETRRIVRLLEQVEQFGDQSPLVSQPVNLHDVLDRARRSALVGAAAHMTILEDYDPSLPLAYGDPDQLLQVFSNLVRNAAEAADPSGGTIRLRSCFEHAYRLRRSDGAGRALPLQVEVIDDGPGIPDAVAAELFDPFVSSKENGTGLGLALANKVISDHGGWITVASVPGETVFRVSLPMAPTARRQDEEQETL